MLGCQLAHVSPQKGFTHGISHYAGLSAGTLGSLNYTPLDLSLCAGLLGCTPVAQEAHLITFYWISHHAGLSAGTPVTLQRVRLIILFLAGNRTGISESSDKLLGFLSRPAK